MSNSSPPRLARWLLLRCTRLRRHAEIIDDLYELIHLRAGQRGLFFARLRYRWLDDEQPPFLRHLLYPPPAVRLKLAVGD